MFSMIPGKKTSKRPRLIYLRYDAIMRLVSSSSLIMFYTTFFDYYFKKWTPYWSSNSMYYFTLLLMTSRKIFYSNKMVVRIFYIHLSFTTFHDSNYFSFWLVINISLRYVFFHSIPGTAESSLNVVRWWSTFIMETYPPSSKLKLLPTFSTY